jgi:phosphoesterase RecJ-like protein
MNMKAKTEHIKSAKKILNFIGNNDNFLLSAHINADGDAVASVIATGLLLEKMSKNYFMVFHDQILDSRFDYLPNFKKIINYNSTLNLPINAAVILDVPGVLRLGDVTNILPEPSKVIKIDHHPTEDNFADLNMQDVKASSTTQLVYEIIEYSNIDVDVRIAQSIYTGIVYDTGRFSFSNTTSRDMYICGKMIELGAVPADINNRIFFENSFKALRTIGKGLANMESYFDGAVNVIYLDYESMHNSKQGEIEELANYSVAIRGGEIGLFIREVQPGLHKVSFRSKSNIDVNELAKVFDGGGHIRAAGCRMEGTKGDIVQKIMAEIKKRLE